MNYDLFPSVADCDYIHRDHEAKQVAAGNGIYVMTPHDSFIFASLDEADTCMNYLLGVHGGYSTDDLHRGVVINSGGMAEMLSDPGDYL